MSLLCNQTQHLTLTQPFDGKVAETGHAHSVGEPPIDRRLDGGPGGGQLSRALGLLSLLKMN